MVCWKITEKTQWLLSSTAVKYVQTLRCTVLFVSSYSVPDIGTVTHLASVSRRGPVASNRRKQNVHCSSLEGRISPGLLHTWMTHIQVYKYFEKLLMVLNKQTGVLQRKNYNMIIYSSTFKKRRFLFKREKKKSWFSLWFLTLFSYPHTTRCLYFCEYHYLYYWIMFGSILAKYDVCFPYILFSR